MIEVQVPVVTGQTGEMEQGRGILPGLTGNFVSRAVNNDGNYMYTFRYRINDGTWQTFNATRVESTNAYFNLDGTVGDIRSYTDNELYRQREQKRREAQGRAEALLLSHLTPEQRETWTAHRYFDVPMRTYRFEDVYRIREDDTVMRRRNGLPIAAYCIQARDGDVASADLALAQKILLETDPVTFHRTANLIGQDYVSPLPIPAAKGQTPEMESEPAQAYERLRIGITDAFQEIARIANAIVQEVATAAETFNATPERLPDDVHEWRRREFVELDRRYRDWSALRLRENIIHTLLGGMDNEYIRAGARAPPIADDLMRRFVLDNLSNPIEE